MDIQRIHDDAAAGGFALDAAQLRALDALANPTAGVYLSGPAGRGKSWLADAWFRHWPGSRKRRVHFHAFLDELHRAVFAHQTALRARRLAHPLAGPRAGERVVITSGPESQRDVLAAAAAPREVPDPVGDAIADVVGEAELLVFDEFHLHDPADALLLTRLLEHAAARGVRVVATSNYSPDELLPDPVFHDMAEPAIRLIGATMHHVRLDGDTDYRRVPGSATDLGSAVESTADSGSAGGFTAGVWATDPPAGAPGGSETVRVRDREFEVVSAGAELWITFDQLCSAATSAIEYLDWAERFARWIILDVPGFDGLVEAPRQRFVTAVDVLVDRDVETVFVSRLSREQFAATAEGTRDAERLLSRLALLA
jgi:cell division protein ZapE